MSADHTTNAPLAPTSGVRLVIGRLWCATCQRIFTVIRDVDADVVCDRCGGELELSNGDEV